MSERGNWTNLTWGDGPLLTEWFLEPTCPNCARAFGKLESLLDEAGRQNISVRIILHSQPWHTFSPVVSRAIIAASTLPDGRSAAWRVLSSVFENREDYVAEDHSKGPNMDVSPTEILDRIATQSGVDLREVFIRLEVTDLLKKAARYSRQNGIHASPTVMVDGLVNDAIGSRDPVEEWVAKLGLG